MPVYVWLLPVFIVFIVVEGWLYPRVTKQRYAWGAAGCSIVVFGGNAASDVFHGPLSREVYSRVQVSGESSIALDAWWIWIVLFLGMEFFYYWSHRVAHGFRWSWAAHAVHHSSRELNFPAAGRLPWTQTIQGNWMIYVPLAFVGFDPVVILTMAQLSLIYQFFLHTDLCPKLGPLEWILNTPSHHRVHHAINPEYIGANYGGTLIVFDRLFGTFREEREDVPCRYGLLRQVESNNPVRIAFHEYRNLWSDLCAARSWTQKLRAIFVVADGPRAQAPSLR